MRAALRAALGAVLVALHALGCAPSPPDVQRVILITIDTLRADHLPMYGYPRDTAPFLGELARRGVVFENAFTASAHTAPSHASLFTSRLPHQHGVLRNGEPLDAAMPTLAALLSAQGFDTAAFPSVDFLREVTAGFDHVEAASSRFEPGASAVDRAIAWAKALPPDARFFLWVHLFDVHEWEEDSEGYAPYRDLPRVGGEGPDLSDPELSRFLAAEHGATETAFEDRRRDLADATREYDARIAYVDAQIERLYGALERHPSGRGLWIITSDHGEGLGSHAHVGHGRFLYQEQLHVPLVFAFSDAVHGRHRVARLVRLLDVLPTLEDLLRVPKDSRTTGEGHSLLSLITNDEAAFPVEYSVAERRPIDGWRLRLGWSPGEKFSLHSLEHKYVFSDETLDELYDLAGDPLEAHNRIIDPELAARRDALARALAEVSARGVYRDPDVSRVDEQHTEELRALGYAE